MRQGAQAGLVHWDDPEGWDGEGSGRGVQDREHMYTCTRFMFVYGKDWVLSHSNTEKSER